MLWTNYVTTRTDWRLFSISPFPKCIIIKCLPVPFLLISCYHWRPNLPGGCCICLEQSAGVSTGIAVTASFSQQTEDRAFCPVVQLFWLRASHCTNYHVTSLLFLRVTCPCSLRTYATLKFIRSSSSSSSSEPKWWCEVRVVSVNECGWRYRSNLPTWLALILLSILILDRQRRSAGQVMK